MERTDAQIYEEEIDIQLGRTYTVRILPIKPSRQWVKRAKKYFQSLAGESSEVNAEGQNLESEAEEAAISEIHNLVYEYAPNIDRELAEEEASDNAFVAAFMTLYKVANPLSRLWEINPANAKDPVFQTIRTRKVARGTSS